MTFVLAVMLAMMLVITGGGWAALHDGGPWQVYAPSLQSYLQVSDTWPIPDPTVSVPLPRYAFAQVSGNTPLAVHAGGDQTVGEGNTVMLSGSAMDTEDNSITYTWSQTGPVTPRITFANASASSTTFTAPSVTDDTVFTFVLTAHDGTQPATDTLNVTVKETGAAFITTWAVSDSDRDITLPMIGTYSILWGDGSHSPDVGGSQFHSYDAAGIYTVTVLGDGLESIRLFGDTANARQLRSIEQWGDTKWTFVDSAFEGAANMVYRATVAPNLSDIASTAYMFTGASSFDGDLSDWNVSSVTYMAYMFKGASSFDGDISDWDVSSVIFMNEMFNGASSFNRPLNSWNVSSVVRMIDMFNSTSSFNQNLGAWYIVPASTDYDLGASSLDVTTISAQNWYLSGQNLTYGVGSGGDSDLFEMRGSTLAFKSTPDAGSYTVKVRASGNGIFESGNNWRTLKITVHAATNDPPEVHAGGDQTVGEGDTVTLSGSATDPEDNSITYTWSQTGSAAAPRITFANASAPSTTFTAPSVTGDTTFTFVLTAHDGAQPATDTLNVTVKETRTAFITTWTTSDTDRDITLPMNGTYSVLWGDGSHSPDVSGSQSHSYNATGTYTVTVLGEGLENIYLYGDPPNARQLRSIEQWGSTEWTSMDHAFYGANNMVYNATDVPNLSGVTDMGSMFVSANAFNGDLSYWDVSSVTNMVYMFSGTTVFNSDLSDWDVSSVTNMGNMFSTAIVFNSDLSDWDVSSVTNMGNMFSTAFDFDSDLSGWNVSSVTNMSHMFSTASSFNSDLSGWNVSSVLNMNGMFSNALVFRQNMGHWYVVLNNTSIRAGDTSNVVGTISAQNKMLDDQNPTYGLGAGGDSDLFVITGSTLNLNPTADYSNKTWYSVNITSTGDFGTGNHHVYGIAVSDTDITISDTAPTVTSIKRHDPAVENTNSQILIYKVTFSEDVTGVTESDFILSPGSTGRVSGTTQVTDISGSGDTYHVTVSSSTDGTYNLDLVSSGHGIADESSNQLANTAPTGADQTYTVSTAVTDNTAPTVSSIERHDPSTATTGSQTLIYKVTFSENVSGVDKSDFALSSGSTGGTGGGGTSEQFTQTRSPELAITQANTISDTITVSDSGTATSVSVAVNITHTYIGDLKIDLIAPDGTTKIVRERSGGSADDIDQTYTPDFEGESIAGTWTLRINDNYALKDDGTLNSWTLTINHGSSSSGTASPVTSISGSGSVYYAEVSASTDGTYNLDLVSSGHGIADESSNQLANTAPTGADQTYTVSTAVTDNTAPTVSSIERHNPSTATTGSQTLIYKVTFSEDVSGVDKSDFALSSGSTGGTGGGGTSEQFTQTRSPELAITQANTISDTITVSDSGTATSVSVAVNITHTYIGDLKIDLIAPDGTTKIVRERSGGNADDIDQTYTPDFEGESIAGTWTLRINDNYAAEDDGFLNSWTLTINHGSSSSGTASPVTSISGSGSVYYAEVSASTDGTYNLDLVSSGHGIADESSNQLANTAPTGADQTYTVSTAVTDNTAPTVSSIERHNPSTATTGSQTLIYKVTFSEDVSGVDKSDFALSSGSTGGTGGGGTSEQFTQTRSPELAITQANTISDTITVSDSGTATSVSVAVNITHTYIGDLKIDLIAPDGTTKIVRERSGGNADDIDQTYTPDFEGESIAGTWTLRINDNYALKDDGTLNSWTLTINHGSSSSGTTSPVTSISGSGSVYYAEVSASTDGTYNLDLVSSGHGIADESSNQLANTAPTGADQTYTVSTAVTDNTAPTVSSIERHNPSTATTGSQTLIYKVTFSEDVSGVDKSDFALSSGSTGGTGGGGTSEQFTQTRSPELAITQANTISDTITVSDSGTATSVSVAVNITHTYIGDLKIDLIAPDGTTKIVRERSGGNADDIDQTYTPDFEGESIAGTWTLRINDNYAAEDDGFLNSWTLTINHGSSSSGTASPVTSISGSGSVYYAEVSASTDGTYNLDLASSGHNIVDAANNPLANTSPTGADETYTVSTAVTDNTNPRLASIERYIPASQNTDSQSLRYKATFSESVTGVTASDFVLSTGSTGRVSGTTQVTGISGSGDTYHVTVSSTTDGTYNLDLVSSDHGIKDAAGNPLNDTVPTTGTDETYTVSTATVDTANPTLESIERHSPADENTASQTLIYEVTFSENVTGIDTSDFVLSSDNAGGVGGTNTGSGSGQFVQTREPGLEIPHNQTVTDTISVAGSGTATSISVAVDITHQYIVDLKIDLIAPDGTVQTLHNREGGTADIDQTYLPDFGSVSIAGDWILRIHDNIPIDDGILNSWTLTINYGNAIASTPVTGVSGSGEVYHVTVSALQDGTYNLDLVSSGHGIADESNNQLANTSPTGADETYTVSTAVTDNTNPRLASIERYIPASQNTDSQYLLYKATFSESVMGVTASDFVLSTGSTGRVSGTTQVTDISGSGDTYHVTVSSTTDGTYNLDLVSSGHNIVDAANNQLANTDPTGADQTYTVSTAVIDNTNPRLASIERYIPASQNTNSQSLIYKATFSESVMGVTASDFVLSPGSTGRVSGTTQVTGISGSGDTYHITVSPSTDGTYNLDLVLSGHNIVDAANNPLINTATTGADQTYTVSTAVIDNTNPRLASIERYIPASQNTNHQLLAYKVTFSKNVTGVTESDFTLSPGSTGGRDDGTSSVIGVSGSGDTYRVTVLSSTDGTYNLDLVLSGHNIVDTANNPLTNTATTGADQTYTVSTTVVDSPNPTLESIERRQPASQNTNSKVLIYKVTFSKSVTGVDISDFVLSPGSTGGRDDGKSPIATITNPSDGVYNVIVSLTVDGTCNLDLVLSGHNIADAADNQLINTVPTTGIDQTYTVI